jgi:uncharacterized coiled-coil protein SlyX
VVELERSATESLLVPPKDTVPVYDIDSDREGSQETPTEDRLNLEKFRTAATVKQVERSEQKIHDLNRQVQQYESTVDDLRDQVKTLTSELKQADQMLLEAGLSTPRRAGNNTPRYSSGTATPQGPTAVLPTSPRQAALMVELSAKLRSRRDSEGSSVSGAGLEGSPGRRVELRRTESSSSLRAEPKNPGAEYLKVLRPSPRSPQMKLWTE